jgi:mycothiol synthase
MIRSASFPADRRHVMALLEEVEAHGAGPALSEESRWHLEHGPDPGSGLVALSGGGVAGYAHLMPGRWHLIAEIVVASGRGRDITSSMVAAVLEAAGEAPVRFRSSDSGAVMAALQAGMVPFRTLLRMEAALPVPAAGSGLPDGVVVRGWRNGEDEDAFLLISNQAFADHPDSGGWDREALAARMSRPWFDAAGLFLAWDRDEPAGLCWTKRHSDGLGEIYSVAVRPGWWGRGLGRALVVTGLRHLYRERGARRGLIYVEGGNPAALALYRSLGFTAAGRVEELVIGAASPSGS